MKDYSRIILIAFFMMNTLSYAWIINGKIVDQNNSPVSNANIIIENSNIGTISDQNGVFYIRNIRNSNCILKITHINFQDFKKEIYLPLGKELILKLSELELSTEDVEVTVSQIESKLKDSPLKITVIDNKDIENNTASSIENLLQNNGSFQLEKSAMQGTTVKLQGLPSKYTVVLIDGERIIGSHKSIADISQISLDNVERIEIVEGPTSSLYGSDCLGGVLNIITKNPNNNDTKIKADYGVGSNYTNQYAVNLSAKSESQVGISLSNSGYYTEGMKLSDKNWYNNSSLRLNIKNNFNPSISYRYNNRNLQKMKHIRWSTVLPFKYMLNENNTINFSTSYKISRKSLFEAGNTIVDHEKQLHIKGNYIFKYSDFNSLVGFDFSKDFYDSQIINKNSQKMAIMTQLKKTLFPNFITTLGARLDYHESWNNQLSPSLNVLYRPSEMFSIRAGGGLGFKAPSVSELYSFWYHPYGGGFWIKGNKELDPETSQGINLNLDVFPNTVLQTNLSLFYNRLKNMINITLSEETHQNQKLYTYINVDKISTKGVGYGIKLNTSWIEIGTDYKYLRTKNWKTKKMLPLSPEHSVTSNIFLKKEIYEVSIRTGLRHRFKSKQYTDTQNKYLVTENSFFDYNLGIKTKYHINFYLSIDNIFDKQHKVYDDMPGRTFLLKMQCEL